MPEIEEVRRAAAIKAEVSIALDTAVAALVGIEFLGTERRRELAAMLTRARLAVEESL